MAIISRKVSGWILVSWLLKWNLVMALYEQCNHVYKLQANEQIYINSPYYPNLYPIGTSCRYIVVGPQDYELQFKCTINLNSVPSISTCENEVFYFNREGTQYYTASEYFCGKGSFERSSFLNKASFSYVSTPAYQRNSEANIDPRNSTNEFTKSSSDDDPTRNIVALLQENVASYQQSKANGSSSDDSEFLFDPDLPSVLPETTTAISIKHLTRRPSVHYNQQLQTTTTTTTRPFLVDSPYEKDTMPPVDDVFSNAFHYLTSLLTNNFKQSPQKGSGGSSLPKDTWRLGLRKENALLPKVHKRRNLAIQPDSARIVNNFVTTSEGGGWFSCFITAVQPACDCGWSMALKIAGSSTEASVNEFASMAGVISKRTQQIFCGATIIHHRYLLSAAHCFIGPETSYASLVQVVVGEHDLSTSVETPFTRYYDISTIIMHEHFKATISGVRNDIALLKTSEEIVWNRSVGPACLPLYEFSPKPPIAGDQVIAAGWGTTSFGGQQSSILRKTTLDVISSTVCKYTIGLPVPPRTFCTFTPGRDTCQYDSGGALYYRRDGRLFAFGIVSYGYACATNKPSVNTKVASFVKWILNKTPEVKYCMQ